MSTTKVDSAKIEKAMDALLQAILKNEVAQPAPIAIDLGQVAKAAETASPTPIPHRLNRSGSEALDDRQHDDDPLSTCTVSSHRA
jgi:hypothetical protein